MITSRHLHHHCTGSSYHHFCLDYWSHLPEEVFLSSSSSFMVCVLLLSTGNLSHSESETIFLHWPAGLDPIICPILPLSLHPLPLPKFHWNPCCCSKVSKTVPVKVFMCSLLPEGEQASSSAKLSCHFFLSPVTGYPQPYHVISVPFPCCIFTLSPYNSQTYIYLFNCFC